MGAGSSTYPLYHNLRPRLCLGISEHELSLHETSTFIFFIYILNSKRNVHNCISVTLSFCKSKSFISYTMVSSDHNV